MSSNEVQVPESSSPMGQKLLSSSPLRPDMPANNDMASLRQRFTFEAESEVQPVATTSTSREEDITKGMGFLAAEFPDFSPTLVQAVFKSNNFSIELSKERLNKIRQQRSNWAWNDKKSTLSQGATKSIRTSSIQDSSKITLNKQKTSIFDRYSSVMNNQGKRSPVASQIIINEESLKKLNPEAGGKRRRLVRGDDASIINKSKPTHLEAAKNKLLKKSKNSIMDDEEEESVHHDATDDEDMSGEEYEERIQEENIDDQLLQFINTSEPNDIADIADISIDKAKVIVSKKPFESLKQFMESEYFTDAEQEKMVSQEKKGKRKGRNYYQNDSERLIDKMSQSIKGYNAIDSLIKKCASYGDLLSVQMKKWGIDLESGSSDALNVMALDTDDQNHAVVEEFDDSVISPSVTPSLDAKRLDTKKKFRNNSGSDFDDEDDEEFHESEEDDEDYDITVAGRRKTSRNRVNIQKNKIIKFFKGKPKMLSNDIELKDYQQSGINWLNLLYQNHMSCILADDMGLGKTCQVISFIAYLKQINEPGPHLVVVPSSTLENWLREFQKFCPSLKIEPYYGSQQERADLRDILEDNDGQYDVIVTTYNLAAGNKQDVSFLRNRNFNVIIYDEGHMLKNSLSERFSKLMKVEGNFRLLLTGTPLQNNLRELMSLLEFIMPSIFESKKESLTSIFKQRARTTDANKEYNPLLAQEAINRAKTMMKPFILRRRKDQVLKHLPAKHKHIAYCEMTDVQRQIYDKEIKLVMEHKRMIRDGKLPKDPKQVSKIKASSSKNLIMALRKASLHPLLYRHIYDDKIISKMSDAILDEPQYAENGNKQYIKEDMSYMTDFELDRLCNNFPDTLSKFKLKNDEWMDAGKIEKLCEILKDIIVFKKEKVLIFSLFTQMLDILESVLSTLNYKFLRLDGSTQVNDRQSLIDKFYEDDTIPVFILSTKAGGFGINLVCANNVIIYDQSFNPHDDRQAADRAHRVGQTKEVNITTLIMKNSIEEKILQLAKNKLDLDTHISEDDKKGQDALENKVSDILEDIIFNENG